MSNKGRAAMDVHDVLVRTKNLIPTEADWCGTGWTNQRMGQCLVQALCTTLGIADEPTRFVTVTFHPAYKLLTQLAGTSPYRFNDTHSFAEVHRLLDDAIAISAPTPDVSVLEEHTAVVA